MKEEYKNLYLARNIDSLDLLAKKDMDVENCKFSSYSNSLRKLFNNSKAHVLDQEWYYILLSRYLLLYQAYIKHEKDKKFVTVMFGAEFEKVSSLHKNTRDDLIRRYAALQNKSIDDPSSKKMVTTTANIKKIFLRTFITPRDLISALTSEHNILIVDARPDFDFAQSMFRFRDSVCINIPDQSIATGMSAHVVGQALPAETQKIWEKRDNFEAIVLYDWNTTQETFHVTKLEKLYSALVDWDFLKQYNQDPVIINGGYLEILDTYPTLCCNPLVYLSRKNNELDDLLNIDKIEYPTETDNRLFVMPAESVEESELELDSHSDEDSIRGDEVLAKLQELKTELKRIQDHSNGDESDEENSNLQQEKNALENSIVNYENMLNNVSITNEVDPNTQQLKILNTISEDRLNELKKARALKPRTGNTKQASDDKPVIDRATKPSLMPNILTIGDTDCGFVGLSNISNTCYMNTILQCFRNLSFTKELFFRRFNSITIHNPAALMHETFNLLHELWTTNKSSIVPTEFFQKCCLLEPVYKQGAHEDCMEFFLFFINHLSEDTAVDIKRPDVMTPKQKAWYNQFQGKTSVMIDGFYHEIRIHQSCFTCGHSTYKFEIENTFMLSVPDNDFHLSDLLDNYMANFIIPEYCCAKCKKPVNNSKQICYEPYVMVLVLKRYKQDLIDGNTIITKTTSSCRFKQYLKLGKTNYQLQSIALHDGDMNYGHYTAACLTSRGWYEFNDDIVRPINIDSHIVKLRACAFFYCSVK